MQQSEWDTWIATLGKALLLNEPAFAESVKQVGAALKEGDLPYLQRKLHEPPPVASGINERELRLGEWLAICQSVIFELVYQLGLPAVDWVRRIAFGPYDWTQANALILLCRLYLDGELAETILSEIDTKLPSMRHETNLYFAQELVNRRNSDERFDGVIKKITNVPFRLALVEIGHNEQLTREELIALGTRIVAAKDSEETIRELMELFDANVPHPKGSDLLFYPEGMEAEGDDFPTVDAIVDRCLGFGRF